MCCSDPSSAEVACCPSHHLPKGFLVLGFDLLGRVLCIPPSPELNGPVEATGLGEGALSPELACPWAHQATLGVSEGCAA